MAEMQPGMAPPEAPMQEGNEAEQVILNVSQSIGGIAKALEQVNPEAAKAMAQLNEQFQQIIASVSQGGPAAGPSGGGAPEAGGASGAMPAGPQGAVR